MTDDFGARVPFSAGCHDLAVVAIMTRPELPPGCSIRTYARAEGLLGLTHAGRWDSASTSREALVAHAWVEWERANPEWTAYLAHLENPTP